MLPAVANSVPCRAVIPAAEPSLDELADQIAELAAHIHAATYRLLVLIRDFDRREGWANGFRTCAHWLSWRTGIALGASREKVRVARALEHLPQLSRGLRTGRLSYSKVRALTRVAALENDAELLELGQNATAAQIERIVRAWRSVDRAEEQRAEALRHASRSLSLHLDDEADAQGMWVLRGRLDPEVGAVLLRALEAASDALFTRAGESDPQAPTHAQRMADAIGLLAECALQSGLETPESDAAPGTARDPARDVAPDGAEDVARDVVPPHVAQEVAREVADAERDPATLPTKHRADRFQVVLHVESSDLTHDAEPGGGDLADGVRVSAETSRRLACDASRVRMLRGPSGETLSVGRRTRTVPPSIRRALERRDGGCRFPGCGVRFTDAHHVHHWADGGDTRLANLVLLCRRHHRAVHEGGFGVVLRDGRPYFTRPDGRSLPDVPDPVQSESLGMNALRRDAARLELRIGPKTPSSTWNVERFDVGYAVDVLRGTGA